MKKLKIDQEILKRWMQAKIELHSGKLTSKELRQIKEHERMNPCQYCTDFLIEQTDETEETPRCVMCRMREQDQD